MASSTAVLSPKVYSELIRRAPFCIYAKRVPSTLPKYNVDTDFSYYFYSDFMKQASGVDPSYLTSSNRNAKTEHSSVFPAYFRQDVAVCTDFLFPKIKAQTEPWQALTAQTIVETRKTCISVIDNNNNDKDNRNRNRNRNQEPKQFLLGCFDPHDDLEMGITSFRATHLPPALPPLHHVPDEWYRQAFEQFPLAVRILDAQDPTQMLAANTLAEQNFSHDALPGALNRVQTAMDALNNANSDYNDNDNKFNVFLFGGSKYRFWIWRVESVLAVACRPKRAIMPQMVEDSLTSSLPSFEFDKEEEGDIVF